VKGRIAYQTIMWNRNTWHGWDHWTQRGIFS